MTENKKEERKKTDEEVLFPEMKVKVKGVEYVVKPWSFGELLEVNPTLEKIFNSLDEKGTKIDIGNMDINTIKNIYFASAPQMPYIISKSTTITEEEVMKLSLQDALSFIMTIFSANLESINSFLSLFFAPNENAQNGPEEEVKGQS